MTFFTSKLFGFAAVGGAVLLLATASSISGQQEEGEPIAYVGHGAMFDWNGKEIAPTAEFVAKAQAWYRKKMLADLSASQNAAFAAFEKRLIEGLNARGQARLVVEQRLLEWLVANSPAVRQDGRTLGKLNALKYQLTWKLPDSGERGGMWSGGKFELDAEIRRKLDLPEFRVSDFRPQALVTTNSGQAYIDECAAADVPIPPRIGQLDPAGTAGWKTQGFIPTGQQFIVGTPAEFRTFESPDGMCVALPRYSDSTRTTVALDGVICLSRITSKVCFWDNQMNQATFSFPAGAMIPIGVPNLAIDPMGRYQAGGAELEGGAGGVCTDCHAGENPYIVHPNADLDESPTSSLLMGSLGATLPMFAPNRYDPIVPASWPQNALSHSSTLVPAACITCHQPGGTGRRFPHLSSELNGFPGYCRTILRAAIEGTATSTTPMVPATMPQGSPGSEAGTQATTDFLAWCGTPASAGPSNRGDPHLTTTNTINYDFQAAGEFVALRDSDTGFELQTRQTPVSTSFVPGANPYTGLASCVSLNTAVALRVNKRRITYQPLSLKPGAQPNMQLRIDNRPAKLSREGTSLGGGARIASTSAGSGFDLSLADRTRVIVTSNYWTSEGYWYLNVEVLRSPAREGTMGHIPAGNWLPLAPNGSSFGPMPASLAARDIMLNRSYADAWRVTAATSLFAYAPGTSTTNFTDRNWPPKAGAPCNATLGWQGRGGPVPKPVQPMKGEEARRLCGGIKDKAAFDNCVFDVTATGDAGQAKAYQLTLTLRAAAM